MGLDRGSPGPRIRRSVQVERERHLYANRLPLRNTIELLHRDEGRVIEDRIGGLLDLLVSHVPLRVNDKRDHHIARNVVVLRFLRITHRAANLVRVWAHNADYVADRLRRRRWRDGRSWWRCDRS